MCKIRKWTFWLKWEDKTKLIRSLVRQTALKKIVICVNTRQKRLDLFHPDGILSCSMVDIPILFTFENNPVLKGPLIKMHSNYNITTSILAEMPQRFQSKKIHFIIFISTQNGSK